MFSSGHGRGTDPRKDSQRNAEESGEFVCNMATYDLREEMNATSESVPIEVDELALAGLTPLPSKLVQPPRVAESPVHLECRYLRPIELPRWASYHTNALVPGEVVDNHIN